MARHIIWACAAILMLVPMFFAVRDYNIEAEKQNAFMMSACVTAGGEWRKNFGPTWNCVRPERTKP